MQQQKPSPTPSIFCAAASSDTGWLASWERHLLPLVQAEQITVWSEQHLMAGTPRLQQINDHLDHADVIVFLLSAEFFASDECLALMERAMISSARVIPLLLRPVDWKTSKLANLACLPANGQFVTTWDNLDLAFQTCVNDLCRLLRLPAIQAQTYKSAQASTLQNQNRERMLRRLRRSYSDLMNQSLQGAAWLELGRASKPDAVQNATNLLLRVSNRPEQHLPPGTSITQAYDESEHELLILGEPGAGKSTLLLDLAEHLVERAEHDETHQLPVILPLSSWATKRPKLEDWIAEQTSEIYDVPRKVSREWMKEGRILPLLDGLDEMDEAALPVCIATINTYHREHLAPLVVCSRTNEYEGASEHHRLALQGAVVVQPLTHEDVETYLIQAGKPLTALRSTLKKNTTLHNLATTPLMLNILTLTYQGSSVRSLSTKGPLLLQQIWNDYVERMVTRKGNSQRYPLERTRAWLSWLAQQMRKHNQAVFYLEHLQPDWLSTEQQRIYAGLAIRLPAVVIGVLMNILVQSLLFGGADLSSLLQSGVLGGLFGGIWHESARDLRSREELRHVWGKRLVKRIAVSACIGLIYGFSFVFYPDHPYIQRTWETSISYGIVFGLTSLLLQYLLARLLYPDTSSGTNASQIWKRAVRFWSSVDGSRALLVASIIWMSDTLSYQLIQWLNSQSISLDLYSQASVYGLSGGLTDGLGVGLSYVLISLVLSRQMAGIHPTERLGWTRRSLKIGLFNPKHLRSTVLLAALSFFFSGLSIWLVDLGFGPSGALAYGLSFGLSTGLSFGLGYWFLLGLFQGTTQERIEDQDRRVANQGIHYSLRNSVIASIIGGGVIGSMSTVKSWSSSVIGMGLSRGLTEGWSIGLGYALSYTLSDMLSDLVSQGLVIGVSGALLICILIGGLAVWRHYVLRFLLWRSRTFPWRAPQFLDDATARFLLRRVGGGYSFAHRLLLDHLADGETEPILSVNVSPTRFPHP